MNPDHFLNAGAIQGSENRLPGFKSSAGRQRRQVNVRLKDFCGGVAELTQKMAEVHGNRTHLGRC